LQLLRALYLSVSSTADTRGIADALWNVKFGFEDTPAAYRRRVDLNDEEVRRWSMHQSIESFHPANLWCAQENYRSF
jgi:hypothetical protein